MKATLIFFSYIVLMALIAASGFGVHFVFAKVMALTANGGEGFGVGLILILHLLAAALVSSFCWIQINESNNK